MANSKREELKACPFCNGPAADVAGEWVQCGGDQDCIGRTIRADREQWNTRPPQPTEGLAAEYARHCEAADKQVETGKFGPECIAFGEFSWENRHAILTALQAKDKANG